MAADAGLIGDDGVGQRLVVVEEDCDGQGGSAVRQVDVPSHLVAQGQDVGEEFE
ncbi:hypothetical protein ACQEV2_00290 [Streptomyces sp. CA-251387]|uniref:hypothetical protein n=1 Tax=Streptomyces sp. CA-251387 TaxID=3240064 RepID=UPI003D8D6120